MRTQSLFCSVTAAAVLTVGGSARAQVYDTIDIDGATFTTAHGINPWGDIVGSYVDVAGVTHGYLLRSGDVTPIDVPGATLTRTLGINAGGEIAGEYVAAGSTHGFLLTNGSFKPIDYPGLNVTLTTINDVNDLGDIVGRYVVDGVSHGFLLTRSGWFTTIDIPGASFTGAIGINNAGDIVGRYQIANGPDHGYLIRHDDPDNFQTIDYPDPGATRTLAFSINDTGDIVGNAVFGTHECGFLLSVAGWELFEVPDSILTRGLKINASGDIVGRYDDTTGRSHGYLRLVIYR